MKNYKVKQLKNFIEISEDDKLRNKYQISK